LTGGTAGPGTSTYLQEAGAEIRRDFENRNSEYYFALNYKSNVTH